MLTFRNGSQLHNYAIVQSCNRLISEEADRRISLLSIPKHRESTHRESAPLENNQLINLVSEPGWAATIEREFTDGSAISPDTFETEIDIVEDTGYWEPNELLGQSVSRQWQTCKPHSYGALAVFLSEDRSPWQAKPQNPRIDKRARFRGANQLRAMVHGHFCLSYLQRSEQRLASAIK